MLINISNHPSAHWSESQLSAAHIYGEVIDLPFPQVPATADEKEIESLAEQIVMQVGAYISSDAGSSAIMCQGEFTLAFHIVEKCKQKGYTCLAACSERVAKEYINDNGSVRKESVYEFVQFRRY